MIYAPAYAFHQDHPPGAPGAVYFLGLFEAETVEELQKALKERIASFEVAIAYPYSNDYGTATNGLDSFEVLPK